MNERDDTTDTEGEPLHEVTEADLAAIVGGADDDPIGRAGSGTEGSP